MEKKSIPFRRGRSNFSKSAKEDHSRVSQSHGVAGVEHTLLRLVHKRCRPQLLQLDDSSINSSTYGFYTVTLVVLALSYICIAGPARRGPQLPLSVSFRGYTLETLTYTTTCLALQFVLCLPAYYVEVSRKSALARKRAFSISMQVLITMHVITGIASYGVGYYMGMKIPSVFLRGFLISIGATQQIKTCVYAYVNTDLRREYNRKKTSLAAEELTEIQADGKKMEDENDALSEWAQPYYKESELCPELKSEMKKKAYPNNINFQDYAYFLVAPTLCYQVAYPRATSIKIKSLLFYAVGMCGSYMLAIPLLEDIAIRELELSCANGAAGIETGFINHAAIGINSVIFIFLFFFGFIHCGYSFIAEITMFGDRHFYDQWWNSVSASEYWRMWNLPVVNFNKSILFPCLRKELHLPKELTVAAIFILSGIVHELLFAPMTQCVKMLFFGLHNWKAARRVIDTPTGRMFQNMAFWLQFVVCGIVFLYNLNVRCWKGMIECTGGSPNLPRSTSIVGLVTGFPVDILSIKNDLKS